MILKRILGISSAILLMGVKGCASGPPPWNADFYAADSATQSIQRQQSGVIIQCAEQVFDNYVCLSYEHLELLRTEVLSKCLKWEKTNR